ncbi:hypothetical protein [Paenibacillus sp. 32352]|uniref:hypothetical protein n=1 Tax=Paenibacillus sp. 32352 TaxID=1969111 RepID=UPI0009AC76B2|nr:hypothetical protein [Paenibacillus sp. 32352]
MLKWLPLLLMFADDFFFLAGMSIIVWATFLLNPIAGFYVMGLLFIFIGVILSTKPPFLKKRRR